MVIEMSDMTQIPPLNLLPPRIPASLVCKLAGGYSRSTLRNRIKSGLMPKPVDRAKENLFQTDAVLEKLGLKSTPAIINPFIKALNDKASQVRKQPT